MHYLIIFKGLLRLTDYLNKTIIKIIGILNGVNISFYIINFINNSPVVISFLSVVYYSLNLWWDLIQKEKFNLFIKVGISILGICSKVFSFLCFIFLLFILDHYIKNQEHLFKNLSDNEDESAIIYQK